MFPICKRKQLIAFSALIFVTGRFAYCFPICDEILAGPSDAAELSNPLAIVAKQYTLPAELRERIETDLKNLKNKQASILPELSESEGIAALSLLYEVVLDHALSGTDRLAVWNEFATTEKKARFVYELLLLVLYPHESQMISNFIDSNIFFKGAVRQKHDAALIITSSFEKETPSQLITLYFRPLANSEQDWLRLSDNERWQRLLSIADVPKADGSAWEIVKTSLAPDFIGPLARESDPLGFTNPVFEFRKDGYALTPDKTLSEIATIAKDFKEGHSFHLHSVFEMRNTDAERARFKVWQHDCEEQLILLGVENGLFPTASTGALTTNLDKFRSFAERDIYGDALKAGYVKIGLELRDVARDVKTTARYFHAVNESIAVESWNQGLKRERQVQRFASAQKSQIMNALLGRDIDWEIASRIVESFRDDDRNWLQLPLADVAKIKSRFNWASGTEEPLSREFYSQWKKGREFFLDGMKKLSEEMRIYHAQTRKYDRPDHIRAAVKWWVSDWAKITKPSQLYRGLRID